MCKCVYYYSANSSALIAEQLAGKGLPLDDTGTSYRQTRINTDLKQAKQKAPQSLGNAKKKSQFPVAASDLVQAGLGSAGALCTMPSSISTARLEQDGALSAAGVACCGAQEMQMMRGDTGCGHGSCVGCNGRAQQDGHGHRESIAGLQCQSCSAQNSAAG